MDERDIGAFLDLVYEAAVDPDLWAKVLEMFIALMGAKGGALIWQNQVTRKGRGFGVGIDPRALDVYFDQFATRHPSQRWANRPRERVRHFVPRIVADDEAMPKAELMRTDFYKEFMGRFDFHSILRLGLTAREDDVAFMMVSRPKSREPFGEAEHALAERLHPHLIRAFELGQKIAASRETAGGAEEVFDRSPHAMFVLDADGRVRRSNAAAQALIAARVGLSLVGGRLTAAGGEASAQLNALIARAAASSPDEREGGSMALSSPDRCLPFSVNVAPIRAEAQLVIRPGPSILVSVTDLEASLSISESRLRQLLGLSPTEARVAVALFEGLTPKEAGERLGVSFNTVRGHLARIFEKTSTGRQSELVRLVAKTGDVWAS